MISVSSGGASSPSTTALSTGRTTYWFSLSSILANTDLQNALNGLPVVAGVRSGNLQVMLPLACTVRGIVVSKSSAVTAGTLTVKPYSLSMLGGVVTNLTANFVTVAVGEKNKYVVTEATLAQFSLLGVRIQASAGYSDGGKNDVVIGVVVDF